MEPSKKVVVIYKRGMQIEEGLRDVKSEHLKLGLNLHRSHCQKRIEVLLLIAAVANYLIVLTGLQARENQLERRYQSCGMRAWLLPVAGSIPLVSSVAVILLIQGTFRFEHVSTVLRLVDKKVGEQRYVRGLITLNPAIQSLCQTDYFFNEI